MAQELTTREQVRRVLEEASVIAVLGAHVEPSKPARYVPDYLVTQGYRVLPVNPSFLGERAWGEPFVASLGALATSVDVVDVFRRSEHLPAHLADLLALRPKVVWLQLGIHHDEVTRHLLAAGIDVVRERCMLADHQALGLGRRDPPAKLAGR